ncbi:peptide chain release factor N(5)-glutamine methyltransferase [Telmatospirillum sp. J64-1]|uniref:peptide chain release factor N(5)-glutamine methyltransferase n=1 Tax=Telmatospirillum sp. J64-1 TaxID=2502183 RepID=UPI00115D282D|nr:peptide chain release factor N(5)-glutamine methyltransferase [Telmatospirillum sp. J64-1]
MTTDEVLSLGAFLAAAAKRLTDAGIPDARLDARLLAAHALGMAPLSVATRPEKVLTPEEAAGITALVERRARREPVSHILGRREFWSMEFRVTADTLDPRPDTETLVEAVLDHLSDRQAPLTLVDFGTGTGCILLALLSELPQAWGVGVDRSRKALAVALENARTLGLDRRTGFLCSDWAEALTGRVNVIVSNPPYIPDEDIAGLEAEVAKFEPLTALAGGPDGLACYRKLAPEAARLLAPGGLAAFEVGQGQAADVADLLSRAGLHLVEIRPDLAGIERCVVARKPA